MWTRRLFSLLLCCLLLVLSAGMCSAGYYQITPEELAKLESNLNELETSLTTSKEELMQARLKVVEYQRDLALQQIQLLKLSNESQQTKDELQNLKKSYSKLEKEAHKKTKAIGLYASTDSFGAIAEYDNLLVFAGPKYEGGYEVGAAVLLKL